MADYVIEVHYGNGTPTLRIPLENVTPDQAEADLQTVREEISHARELGAPYVIRELSVGPLSEHIEVDVEGAVSVDLVDP
jgi:hypothetical protein